MEFTKGKKVFVAGGAGLLGTNLSQYLLDHDVNFESSYYSRKPPKHLIKYYKKYDFTKYSDCLRATNSINYLVIAAVQASGLKGMLNSPTASILPNLNIHAGLLEACVQNNIERVVWISSSTVYQEANYPIKEKELNMNLPPFELYQGVGWVYRYLEELCKCYNQKHGLQISIIRTSNIYGPYDRFDDNRSHVIPALIKRAINKESPFVVWGNKTTIRDFIYIDDLIRNLILVLEEYSLKEPINISFGSPITVEKLVKTILEICDHLVKPTYNKPQLTAVPYRVLDNQKFDNYFGVKSKTTLAEGIRKTVKWYKSNLTRE